MFLFRAWGVIDYGRSLVRVAAISFGLAGHLWRCLSDISKHPRLYSHRTNLVYTFLFFDCDLYDPWLRRCEASQPVGEIVVSSEVILGYTTLGLVLSVLAQNIARRS
jgi:hypothetical protein